jgi:type I restriction enzyme S subunit
MGKPKIRFKGYEDAWEQRKFGEIVEKYEDLVETPTEGYTRLGIRSHAKGTFHSFVEKGKELETAKMFRVAADKFIVNITFGWEHAVAITDENDAGKLVSHRFPQYSFNAGMVPKFFRYLILDENFKHHLELSSPGGAGRNRVLKLNDMLEYKMNFPSEVEQGKIAAYFDHLDHLITLHQRKCEETKSLKKYMLQKMFPENGKCVPEIRFSGFSDAWEQRKLDGWGTFYYGRSCPKWSVTEDATIPCIRYGELYTKFGAKIDRVYSYTNMPPENLRFSKGTEVLIPRVGEDPMDYNHCTWLSMPDVAIGEMISVFNTDNNPLFTATMFNATLQNEFAMRVEGGSVTNLYFEKLKNIEVSFPSIQEQEKIAAYFENLDHLITLHQHKCDELQKLKKFMLQNMFV